LYSVREPGAVLYRDELQALSGHDHSVSLTYAYTRAAPKDWPRLPGRIDAALIANTTWPSNLVPTCYVCGPTSFVENAAGLLSATANSPDRSARFGRIINVTSLVTRGLAFRSSYAAAKAALESITRTMAIELAPDGITANAVAPGPTETELFRSNNPQGSEGEARYLAKVPMQRFAQPSEIAAAIAFLAGQTAAFITGQTLFVDGGASLGSL
jgi:NAD(P)-dependent dehydrogenase (short-subunit alcohol dehydrogenase family)